MRLPHVLAAVSAAAALVVAVVAAPAAAAQTVEQKLSYPNAASKDADTGSTTLGTKFTVARAGKVVGVEFFRVDAQNQASTVQLWGAGTAALASASGVPAGSGWVRKDFAAPVAVAPGTTFIASYFAPSGRYSHRLQGFSAARVAGDLTAPVGAGLYRYGAAAVKPNALYQNEDYYVSPVFVPDVVTPPPPTSTTPPPPPAAVCGDGVDNDADGKVDFPADPGCASVTDGDEADPVVPPPAAGWPGAGNTGVPAGTVLTPYTGPCDIHDNNVVIENKTINCSMLIYGTGTVIRKSKVNGSVYTNNETATLTVEDAELDGGQGQARTVGVDNLTLRRSNVYGNQHTVQCATNCLIEDNWLHDQWEGGAALGWHQNGFITNGGSNLTLRHNTVHCRGGCTADVALIPDYNISNVTIDNNLFVASPDSSECLYGGGHSGNKPGTATGIKVTNNVWQRGGNGKCGAQGPVAYFSTTAPGNVWLNNLWEDGAPVPATF